MTPDLQLVNHSQIVRPIRDIDLDDLYMDVRKPRTRGCVPSEPDLVVRSSRRSQYSICIRTKSPVRPRSAVTSRKMFCRVSRPVVDPEVGPDIGTARFRRFEYLIVRSRLAATSPEDGVPGVL